MPSRGAISRTRVGGKVDIITGTRHGGTGWQFGCNPVQALVLVLLRGLCNTIFFWDDAGAVSCTATYGS